MCYRGREIKCKHLVAAALCAVLWRFHRNERPAWASIRARTILTQEDRVRLDRNFSWTRLLNFTLHDYPSGIGFRTTLLEIDDAARLLAPKQKQARPKKVPSATKKRRKEIERVESETEEREEESYEAPPRKKRILEPPEVTEKYHELLGLATAENDKSIKNWIKQHYSKYWNTITYTGKQQALRCLANLLVGEL